MKKKIIILGASGFIGKNTIQIFRKLKQYKVYGTYLNNLPKKEISRELNRRLGMPLYIPLIALIICYLFWSDLFWFVTLKLS